MQAPGSGGFAEERVRDRGRMNPAARRRVEADAYVVNESWFLKAWRNDPPTNLGRLDELSKRGLPVVPPVPTMDSRLTTWAFALYLFVLGRRAPDRSRPAGADVAAGAHVEFLWRSPRPSVDR